jgi:hypothetical protein
MASGKINDSNLRHRIVQTVTDAKRPVSVEYIAKLLGLSWVTAKAILFDLSLTGELGAIKTTKSWIFTLPRKSLNGRESPLVGQSAVPE